MPGRTKHSTYNTNSQRKMAADGTVKSEFSRLASLKYNNDVAGLIVDFMIGFSIGGEHKGRQCVAEFFVARRLDYFLSTLVSRKILLFNIKDLT